MKFILSVLVFFVSSAAFAQVLDTLRIDTCFNVAFNKTQIDYYYLKKADKDIKLVRSTKILGIAFPAIVKEGFFGSPVFTKTDKTGEKKDGETDTMEIYNPDGSLNYQMIQSYHYYADFEEMIISEKYIVPNGRNWFLDRHPNGKAYRAVQLDSAGKQEAELSNYQIDSFGVSFIQMNKDSNVVVYQKMNTQKNQFGDWDNYDDTPKASNLFKFQSTFCKYNNGITAYSERIVNDTTLQKKIYWRNGNIKHDLKIKHITLKDTVFSLPEEPVWKMVEIVDLKSFDENGVLIKEE